eukprot:jgi/Chlat1/2570/Chrsp175S02402
MIVISAFATVEPSIKAACALISLCREAAAAARAHRKACHKLTSRLDELEPLLRHVERQAQNMKLGDSSASATLQVVQRLTETLNDARMLLTRCSTMSRLKLILQGRGLGERFSILSAEIDRCLSSFSLYQTAIATETLARVNSLRRNLQYDVKTIAADTETMSDGMQAQLRTLQDNSGTHDRTKADAQRVLQQLAADTGMSADNVEQECMQIRQELQELRTHKSQQQDLYDEQVDELLTAMGLLHTDSEASTSATTNDHIDEEPPYDILCPICVHIMSDPVVLSESGHTYDRMCIQRWFFEGRPSVCPLSWLPVTKLVLVPVVPFRQRCLRWAESHGVTLPQAPHVVGSKYPLPTVEEMMPTGLSKTASEGDITQSKQRQRVDVATGQNGSTGTPTHHGGSAVTASHGSPLTETQPSGVSSKRELPLDISEETLGKPGLGDSSPNSLKWSPDARTVSHSPQATADGSLVQQSNGVVLSPHLLSPRRDLPSQQHSTSRTGGVVKRRSASASGSEFNVPPSLLGPRQVAGGLPLSRDSSTVSIPQVSSTLAPSSGPSTASVSHTAADSSLVVDNTRLSGTTASRSLDDYGSAQAVKPVVEPVEAQPTRTDATTSPGSSPEKTSQSSPASSAMPNDSDLQKQMGTPTPALNAEASMPSVAADVLLWTQQLPSCGIPQSQRSRTVADKAPLSASVEPHMSANPPTSSSPAVSSDNAHAPDAQLESSERQPRILHVAERARHNMMSEAAPKPGQRILHLSPEARTRIESSATDATPVPIIFDLTVASSSPEPQSGSARSNRSSFSFAELPDSARSQSSSMSFGFFSEVDSFSPSLQQLATAASGPKPFLQEFKLESARKFYESAATTPNKHLAREVGSARWVMAAEDRRLYCAAWESHLRRWRFVGFHQHDVFKAHEEGVRTAIAMEGLVLTAGGAVVKMWRTDNNQLVASFTETTTVTCMALMDPHLVVAMADGTVSVRTLAKFRTDAARFKAHDGRINAIVAMKSCIITGDNIGLIRVWHGSQHWRKGLNYRRAMECRAHHSPIGALAVSESRGWVFSGALSGNVKVWHLAGLQPLQALDLGTNNPVRSMVIEQDTLFVAQQNGLIKAWSLEDLKCVAMIAGPMLLFNDVVFVSCGRSLYTAAGTSLVAWQQLH